LVGERGTEGEQEQAGAPAFQVQQRRAEQREHDQRCNLDAGKS
jgi:hypothetical protein